METDHIATQFGGVHFLLPSRLGTRGSYAKGLTVEPRAVALARISAALEAIRQMREEGLDLSLATMRSSTFWAYDLLNVLGLVTFNAVFWSLLLAFVKWHMYSI